VKDNILLRVGEIVHDNMMCNMNSQNPNKKALLKVSIMGVIMKMEGGKQNPKNIEIMVNLAMEEYL